jgi:hypothetical protein
MISAHDSGTSSEQTASNFTSIPLCIMSIPSGLAASTVVQITVTDVNDNQPVFSQETYIAMVSEVHTIGASVLTVSIGSYSGN